MNDKAQRIRFTVLISAPDFPYNDAVGFLTPRLSQQFAGASFQKIQGTWSADGHLDREHYQVGDIENGILIRLSVMPEQQESAYQSLRDILQQMKSALCLPIEWIHVETESISAKHFQLETGHQSH